MRTYEERKQLVIEMYNDGIIDAGTFGQLAMLQYSDEIIDRAVERKWISEENAKNIKG